MNVTEILNSQIIKTHLQVKTKEEVLNELACMLKENDYITNQEGFIKDVYAREAEGQTGIGNYIAIPHGKSSYVKKIGVAIATTDHEIPWESLDDQGVKVIILFAVGDDIQGAQEHLKLLSLFARKIGNDEVVSKLLHAEDPNAVLSAFA